MAVTVGELLRCLRKERGLTQQELADRCGMAGSAIRKYESGRQRPKVATLERLASALGVPLAQLLPELSEGDGPPAPPLSEEATQLGRDYDALDPPGQEQLRAAADRELARFREEQEAEKARKQARKRAARSPRARGPRRKGPMVLLEVYEQRAAAGLGNYLDDSPSRLEQYPPEVLPFGVDFGVIISGDSMEPRLHSGGTAFVRALPRIEPGQLGIFVLNGEAYCKRLEVDRESRQVYLVSLNPAYSPIRIRASDDLRTLGRVLGQYTPGQPTDPFGW